MGDLDLPCKRSRPTAAWKPINRVSIHQTVRSTRPEVSCLCEVVAHGGWVKASGETDGERVECLFPSSSSRAELSSSVVSDIADGEVKDLVDGGVGREVSSGLGD